MQAKYSHELYESKKKNKVFGNSQRMNKMFLKERKIGKGSKQIFFQRYTNTLSANKTMTCISSHQGTAIANHKNEQGPPAECCKQ